MKIVLTGGGTGGHFYPLIAVAEALNEIARERKLLPPELYYIAPNPYDARVLFEHDITFRYSPAGKVRRYFSLLNVVDFVKTGFGVLRALIQLFTIFPDVVFSKGGYASFPTLVAARLLRIPVVIHESDAVAGRTNLWAASFARSIGISYPAVADEFPGDKVALVGNPIRTSIATPAPEGAHEHLKLENETPIILILGGSQGAQRINETVLDMLPQALSRYQIIHQTGEKHFESVSQTASVILSNDPNKNRYRAFGYLNELAIRMAAGVASLVISRAGSGTIFEVASWGLPAIMIPIGEEVSRDQHKNAFAFARAGAAVVVDERNLEPNVLLSEIDRLMQNDELRKKMGKEAKAFARPDAARTIAQELLAIALEHEK